ncbi:MAG: shikimate dehydrogenase [Methylococcaceae bacterium]
MMTTDNYSVFGHPINHSKSPRIHRLFAQQTQQDLSYTAQEVSPENFVNAVTDFFNNGGKGLNCTVPLKELAWQYAGQKTERAELSKAVNTLVLKKDGSILGDNTDGIGLVTDLSVNNGIELSNKKLLILGAGGATRGIILPLFEQGISSIVVANRTLDKAVQLANEFSFKGDISGCGFEQLIGQQFDLIINATSASLSGQLPPLPENLLTINGCCYDLAYGNQPTVFVQWGIAQQARKSLDGLGMLVEQAAEAFYLWRGIRPQTKMVIEQIRTDIASK